MLYRFDSLAEFCASRSVTTGKGRKLGPTLLETHKEMRAAKTKKARALEKLDTID